jgi:hypothetical protein
MNYKYTFSGPGDHLARIGGPTTVVASSERTARFKAMCERWGPPDQDDVGGTTERYYGASGIDLISTTNLDDSPITKE